MVRTIREHALQILLHHQTQSAAALYNAILDLRRNPRRGDERVLTPFLDHADAMVAAATLYALCEIHDQRDLLRPLIERLAAGDTRDDSEMPIQTTAISLLSRFGKKDARAVAGLTEIAESERTAETPRKRAWQKLAEMFGVEWSSADTEEMIMHPESDASVLIRTRIRRAMDEPSSRDT